MASSINDRAEQLRILARQDADDQARIAPDQVGGSATLVVQTVQVAKYPTTAGSYYGVKSASVLGAEIEGQAGSVTTSSGTFFALNLGSAVPPAGTQLIATFTGNRWLFVFNG